MLTRLIAMIISLYTQVLNHYAVALKQMSVILQFTFVKFKKKKTVVHPGDGILFSTKKK